MKLRDSFVKESYDKSADRLYEAYKPQMEALQENSPLSKVRSISKHDVVALGEQLDQVQEYLQSMQEDGNLSDLGVIPNVALDIITASYGASVVPLLASIQPIDDERGTIYFKQTKAVDARGNLIMGNQTTTLPVTGGLGQTVTGITAGNIFRNPLQAPSGYAVGYAGETQTVTVPSTPAISAGTVYNMSLTPAPVRERTVEVTVTVGSATLRAVDDGNGAILGVGIYGTVNYVTGSLDLTFTSNVPLASRISVDFGTNFEESGAIPRITTVTASTDIKSEIFTLASELGIFKAYGMKKRFKMLAEEDLVSDIASEITAEIGNTLIQRLYNNAQGVTEFNRRPDSGVAFSEHKLEFIDKLATAETVILNNAGRGSLNVIVAGTEVCALLMQMPNFQKSTITGNGPHVYGVYNGNITVIRAPMLPANEALCIYKGTGIFDAPAVYSPYMPLFVTNTMPVSGNPLKTQGVGAVQAGIKVVVPSFITKVVVVDKPH